MRLAAPLRSSEGTTAKSDGSRSVVKALGVLQLVAVSEAGMTLSEVARDMDLPVTTTARLLKTLEQTRYLTRDAASRYRAGAMILHIGAQALSRSSLYELSERHLKDVSEFTGETAYLAVLSGTDSAVYLRQVESPRAIRHASWTGRTIPTGGTAVGAALAGEVRDGGYASSRATAIEPEAAAVAAPVYRSDGSVLAALSVIGPSYRLSDEQLREYGAYVRAQADQLSSQLTSHDIQR